MNEDARDSKSVFSKAAGTSMLVGTGMALGGAGMLAGSKAVKPVANGIKSGYNKAKNSETFESIKNVKSSMGEKLVNNIDDIKSSAKSSAKSTILDNIEAFENVKSNVGGRFVNNIDDIKSSAKSTILDNKKAFRSAQSNVGGRLVNNIDEIGQSVKSGVGKILKNIGKVK